MKTLIGRSTFERFRLEYKEMTGLWRAELPLRFEATLPRSDATRAADVLPPRR